MGRYAGRMSQAPHVEHDAPGVQPGSNPAAEPGAPATAPAGGGASIADTTELLALVAQIESVAFLRIAGAATAAPDPLSRLRLARLAGAALARQETILGRIAELEGDTDAADELMLGLDATFDDYDQRTQPSSWWEEILKSYVGHGVAVDFCRIVAGALDPQSREIIMGVIEDGMASERSIEVLDRATTDDEVLASRLALWGRRLVGEALSLVQSLLADRPSLSRLLATAIDQRFSEDERPADHTSWLFGQLTAEHTRRMGRLGLAA